MEKKDQIIDNFKNAIKSTVRSISNLKELDVNFDGGVENYLKKYYEKNYVGRFRSGFITESEIDIFLDGGEKILRKI